MDIAQAEATVIPRRFCGSPDTAVGGYVAGLLGRYLDGPARVILHAPVRLDRAYAIERLGAGRVALSDGGAVLAYAETGPLQIEPPGPPSFAEAQWASERYLGFTEHAAPECFVCGPAREWGDGLAVFPGPLPGRGLVAAPWAPDPTLFDRHGVVRAEFVWAALDCPSRFALLEAFGRRRLVLSQLTVNLIRPVEVGERFIVMGWPFAAQGDNLLGASAVFSESGHLHAVASAVLVCAS